MPNNLPRVGRVLCLALLVLTATLTHEALAQARARASRRESAAASAKPEARAAETARPEASISDLSAKKDMSTADELLAAGEKERATKLLERIIEQYPSSTVRFSAYLALGKLAIGNREQSKAIGYLRNIRSIENPDREIPEALRETYIESLYLMGVAYFDMRQYGSAFPLLRRITDDYPNTVWANQSYYYIGMCHFAQENWNKAIEALSLVGTFVDPDSPAMEFVEADRRFYVKVVDKDLPVLNRLGQKISVTIETKNGDKETVECVPMPGNDEMVIGSISTELGLPKPGDNKLQVIGGDIITTTYIDANTQDGRKNVAKQTKSRVVSTGVVMFVLGDYETRTSSAYVAQPSFVLLQDADLDKSPAADTVTIRLVSRTKASDEDQTASAEKAASKVAKPGDVAAVANAETEKYKIRDEMTLTLTEQGTGPAIHTGRFVGKFNVVLARDDQPVDKTDNTLSAALGDEIVAYYTDELHIGGESPREVTDKVTVVNEIENRPRATTYVVADPIVGAKKNLVEASAFLELGRIFKSMGLMKGAQEKSGEGLTRVESVIRSQSQIPSSLMEQAFKVKWELQLVKDDYVAAIATCELFNKLYPESPFVDQALMGIAKVKIEDRKFPEAINIYRRVLNLPQSQSKAEAQFHIAEAMEQEYVISQAGRNEAQQGPSISEAAIAQYKTVADRYRDSEYAGPSLAKLVDYYYETKDFTQANDLLTQIFQDYPDASFLDSMLLKWVMVSIQMREYQRAYDKCSQLIFEYPSSPFAESARKTLPKIAERLKK